MSQPQVTYVAGLHSEGAEKVEEADTEDMSLLEREGRADFLGATQPFSLFRGRGKLCPAPGSVREDNDPQLL